MELSMALRDDEASHPTAVAAALRHPCDVGLSCAFQASYSISPYHFLRIRHLSCRPQHTPATWIPKGKYDGFGSTIVHWNCSCLHRVARTRFQSNSVVWTLAIHPSLPKEFDERVATLHFPALGAALNVLAQEQPDYIGFTVEAPFGLLHPRARRSSSMAFMPLVTALARRSSDKLAIWANSSQIELVRSIRGLCGLRRTSVDWHCQSKMD